MATVFDSHFASAGFPMLLSQFGESINYCPAGGAVRPITAIVERDPPAIFDAAGNAVFPAASIRVCNSCRSGIASNEVDTGTDELEFVLKIGQSIPHRFSILQMTSQDAGVVTLAVR